MKSVYQNIGKTYFGYVCSHLTVLENICIANQLHWSPVKINNLCQNFGDLKSKMRSWEDLSDAANFYN